MVNSLFHKWSIFSCLRMPVPILIAMALNKYQESARLLSDLCILNPNSFLPLDFETKVIILILRERLHCDMILAMKLINSIDILQSLIFVRDLSPFILHVCDFDL